MKFHSRLLNPEDYFEEKFPNRTAYKIFGRYYVPDDAWVIEEGSIIETHLDTDYERDCSYGINICTIDWMINDHYESSWDEDGAEIKFNKYDIWQIEVLGDSEVVVPDISGKIRVNKCKLIKIIDKEAIRDKFLNYANDFFANSDDDEEEF